jgi:hypothetical protein
MKVAVIKLGSRISFNANDTSGGNGEARSIIKMLKEGGADVHIYTKILKKDNLVEDYKWHNLTDILEKGYTSWHGPTFSGLPGTHLPLQTDGPTIFPYDALVVLNGNVNFFGGAEDPEQLLNYQIINAFDGPVYYIFCDPELTLKQVWPSVKKKEWGSKWTEKQLNITRTDITYLSQPHDVEKVLADFGKNEVGPKNIIHFPFEKFPCLNEQLPFNPTPKVDLSYGGTMRGGKRIKKMVKFYFGHPSDISVEMFGKIDSEDFDKLKGTPGLPPGTREPTFTGAVRYDEMLPKMNEAMAHCVIGDPWYEDINDMAQRAYESIWSNVVTFIDIDLDQLRRVYGADPQLADFLYVSTRQELSEKIQLLKTDIELRRHIVEAQLAAINFDAKLYCTSFVNLLKG